MSAPRLIGVLDVGKTNVKMVLHDLESRTDVLSHSIPNRVRQDGPYPHYDVAAIQQFCLDSLADAMAGGVTPDALVVTAHGASGAVIGADGLALPVLDYEWGGPDELAADYDRIRPPFTESFSPRLPGGLNFGAQLFWQSRRFAPAFAGARAIVTYPQFWAWWLTGVAATEATSLGAHTDLWAPALGTWSSLPARAGFAGLMAPLRRAWEPLGPLRRDLASALGLSGPVPVLTGIHDSNASLLPYRLAGSGPLQDRAMTVVSTGTWMIAFGLGTPLAGLDPTRDTLANVDAFGAAVPSARFMAGREFELIAGPGERPEPDRASIDRVIERQIMVLPTLVPGSGPFANRGGCWSPAGIEPRLTATERVVVASLYTGLVTATCLSLLQARGPTVVEGPFSRNALYCDSVAWLTGRPIVVPSDPSGSAAGAALLATIEGDRRRGPSLRMSSQSLNLGAGFDRYAAVWAERAAELPASTALA